MEKLNLSLPGLSVSHYDPIAHGRMRADTINSTPGDLTDYDCPKCRNRGFLADIREDGSLYTKDCSCMRIRRCIREMEKSGLKNSIQKMTFQAFQADADWQKTVLKAAKDYAGQNTTDWFVMCGQSGSGKTHLCTAICRQRLWAGQEVRYMSWRETVTMLKAMSLDSEKRTELMDRYRNAQILYIDDFYKCGKTDDGKSTPTQSDINLAFELINHRYINNLVTILSTERTPHELVAIDEAIGSRIIERASTHMYHINKDLKKNYRMHAIVDL